MLIESNHRWTLFSSHFLCHFTPIVVNIHIFFFHLDLIMNQDKAKQDKSLSHFAVNFVCRIIVTGGELPLFLVNKCIYCLKLTILNRIESVHIPTNFQQLPKQCQIFANTFPRIYCVPLAQSNSIESDKTVFIKGTTFYHKTLSKFYTCIRAIFFRLK